MQDGFYGVAQQKFQAYLDAAFFQKSKAKGAVYLAQALLGQGKAADAAKFLTEHWGWRKDTPSEGAFSYWLARAQFESGDAELALASANACSGRTFEGPQPNRPSAGMALTGRSSPRPAISMAVM